MDRKLMEQLVGESVSSAVQVEGYGPQPYAGMKIVLKKDPAIQKKVAGLAQKYANASNGSDRKLEKKLYQELHAVLTDALEKAAAAQYDASPDEGDSESLMREWEQEDWVGDELTDFASGSKSQLFGIETKQTESVQTEAESAPSDKLLMHLASAASSMGVDASDKDAVAAFLDQLKALVTSDKTTLMTALRKYSGKDAKALSKKALAEKPY